MWDTRVSPGIISNLNKKIHGCIIHYYYYRNVLALVPQGREKEIATMLKENLEEAAK